MRTSSYVIYVDLPGRSEQKLLVHGYTGAFDLVSSPVAKYLRSKETRPAPKPFYGSWASEPHRNGVAVPPPSDDAISTLRRRGYLTDLSPTDEERLVEKIAGTAHDSPARKKPRYVVMPTYNCNLRCAYCFQDHMRTDSNYRHLLRTMAPELIDRMFLAMPHLETLQGVPEEQAFPRDIGFFGGEPLGGHANSLQGASVGTHQVLGGHQRDRARRVRGRVVTEAHQPSADHARRPTRRA